MLEYYQILRSVRKTEAVARQQCLIRCRHCRIFFLTHRRNHRRLHWVSCPFGCRAEHERRESRRRSDAYYREHPEKKRALNQRRYRLAPGAAAHGAGSAAGADPPPAVSAERTGPPPSAARATAEGRPGPSPQTRDRSPDVDPPPGPSPQRGDPASSPACPPALAEVLPKARDPEVIGHVRDVVSLIEGRPVSLEELWETLLNFWRQRTMGQRRKLDHTLAWLKANPP